MPVTETISLPKLPEAIAAMPDDTALSTDVAALTVRMSRGDEPAWREFYDLYFNRLLRYLLVVAGGREEAAREALQLTMLRIVKHIRRFDSEPAFWSWLTVLARSAAVDEQRKRARYLAVLDRFFRREQLNGAAVNHDADAHLSALLEQNLEELAEDERRLVESKYFARSSVKEIADELQTTEKAIESRLARIRRKLKDAVLAQLNDEQPA